MAESKKCPACGGGVDMTKDGKHGHCAGCNEIYDYNDESKEQPKSEKKDGSAESAK